MPAPLSAEATALIDRPNFAHVATLMADGSPHGVPVWVGVRAIGSRCGTSEGSLKGRNTRRDPWGGLPRSVRGAAAPRPRVGASAPTRTSRSWTPYRTSTSGSRS